MSLSLSLQADKSEKLLGPLQGRPPPPAFPFPVGITQKQIARTLEEGVG